MGPKNGQKVAKKNLVHCATQGEWNFAHSFSFLRFFNFLHFFSFLVNFAFFAFFAFFGKMGVFVQNWSELVKVVMIGHDLYFLKVQRTHFGCRNFRVW